MRLVPQETRQMYKANRLSLLYRTVKADKRAYCVKARPFGINRLLTQLNPSLERPIFLVGAPRSGTTFLGRCFSKLSGVSYHFEPIATKVMSRSVYEKSIDLRKASRFYRNVYEWLMRLHLDGDLRFAEKTPRNSFIISFLSEVFPDAQFIHIIRDGRDSALSYSKKPWLQASQANSSKFEPGGYPIGPYPRFWVERHRLREFRETTDIHRCIWAWRRFTEAAIQAASSLSDNRYIEIRFEDFVTEPKVQSDRILSFIGLSNSDSKREFMSEARLARPTTIGQWKRELDREALVQVECEASSLLHSLGYT